MNQKPLSAVVERITRAAIRGRTQDGQEFFEIGATGVSITHGYTHALKKRAVLICATGPNGEESDIVAYEQVPSNNALRETVGRAVRSLVARVEGIQSSGADLIQ